MTNQWLDTMSAKVDDIKGNADELRSLSRAFGQTGNTQMYELLWYIADDLERIAAEIQTAISDKVHDEYTTSRDALFGAMQSVLDVVLKKEADGRSEKA